MHSNHYDLSYPITSGKESPPGIDQAALSKLETGSHGNPTLETLYRIALSLGKVIVCVLQDAPANPSGDRRPARAR